MKQSSAPNSQGLLNVRQLGAAGDGTTDDTAAFLRAITLAKANLSYPGGGSQAGIFMPPGNYLITSSLDATTTGGVQGLVMEGSGQLQSQIVGTLADGAYPVLDCTGVSRLQLRNFQVRAGASSLASCCLLLAQATVNTFHNRQADLENLLLTLDAGATNGVNALIVQNADISSFTNVTADGGAAMGWRLPSQRQNVAQAGSTTTITLDTGASVTNNFYTGYPIRITSGTGAGQISHITNYVGSTKVATAAFSVAPDNTSNFEISAIKSKYQAIQSAYDQTNYWNESCAYFGGYGLMFTGGVGLGLANTYLSRSRIGDANKAALLIPPQDAAESPGAMYITGTNLRTENQTTDAESYAIVTAQSDVSLSISGSLDVIDTNSDAPTGTVLLTTGAGGFQDLALFGITAQAPLFNVTGDIQSLTGAFRADTPGTVSGVVDLVDFSWGNPAHDAVWNTFLGTTAAHNAQGRSGFQVPPVTAVLPGVTSAPFSTLGLALEYNATNTPYTGGSGQGTAYSWVCPAGLITGRSPIRRKWSLVIRGVATQTTTIQPFIRQSSTSIVQQLTGAISITGGRNYTLNVLLDNLTTAKGVYAVGELILDGVVHQFVVSAMFGSLDPAAPFELDLDVNSAMNDPINVASNDVEVR